MKTTHLTISNRYYGQNEHFFGYYCYYAPNYITLKTNKEIIRSGQFKRLHCCFLFACFK